MRSHCRVWGAAPKCRGLEAQPPRCKEFGGRSPRKCRALGGLSPQGCGGSGGQRPPNMFGASGEKRTPGELKSCRQPWGRPTSVSAMQNKFLHVFHMFPAPTKVEVISEDIIGDCHHVWPFLVNRTKKTVEQSGNMHRPCRRVRVKLSFCAQAVHIKRNFQL